MKDLSEEQSHVIEPEILDESGQPVSVVQDHARPKGDTGGVLGGILVLAVGLVMTVFVALFTLFIVCPFVLLGRCLGLSVHRMKE